MLKSTSMITKAFQPNTHTEITNVRIAEEFDALRLGLW